MQITPAVMTVQLLNLLTSMLLSYEANSEGMTQQDYENMMVYAIAWSCGALFEPEDRQKFNAFLKDKMLSPHQCEAGLTIFDYFVDPKTKKFRKWVAPDWSPPKGAFSFSSILIPTLDSERFVEDVAVGLKRCIDVHMTANSPEEEVSLRYGTLCGRASTGLNTSCNS